MSLGHEYRIAQSLFDVTQMAESFATKSHSTFLLAGWASEARAMRVFNGGANEKVRGFEDATQRRRCFHRRRVNFASSGGK